MLSVNKSPKLYQSKHEKPSNFSNFDFFKILFLIFTSDFLKTKFMYVCLKGILAVFEPPRLCNQLLSVFVHSSVKKFLWICDLVEAGPIGSGHLGHERSWPRLSKISLRSYHISRGDYYRLVQAISPSDAKLTTQN